MNRTVWLSILSFALFIASDVRAGAFSYPKKEILQKVDRVLSVTVTAALISGCVAGEHGYTRLKTLSLYTLFGALGVNVIVNALALKHGLTARSLLKLFLPTSSLGASMAYAKYDGKAGEAADVAAVVGFGGNVIKNIWDIYSILHPEQSENTQHD